MTWEHHRQRSTGDRVFSGILLVGVGALLLLSNLNIYNAMPLFRLFWPLILVLFGIKYLFTFKGVHGITAAAFWAGTGLLFLASNLNYIPTRIPSLIWPVMIIWFGVMISVGFPRCGSRHIENGSEM